MKTIGIKLADGTFYPILKEGEAQNHTLDVTTVKDNQTKVQIDLYRSETASMDDAEYVDTLEVTKLNPHPNGEPTLHLSLDLDENNGLTAKVLDDETGEKSETQVSLVNRTLAERENTEPDFTLAETAIGANELSALEAEEAKPDPKPFTTEDFSFDTFEDEPPAENADSPAAEADDFNLDDITLDLPPLDLDDAADKTEDAAAQTAEEPATDSVPAEPNGDDDFSLDDIPLDLPDFDEPQAAAQEIVAEPTEDFTAEAADMPDFDDETFAPSETTETEPAASDADVPDFSYLSDDGAETETADEAATGEPPEDSFDLPDFGDLDDGDLAADNTIIEETATDDSADETESESADTAATDDIFAELDESNANDDLAAVALPDFDEPSDSDSTAFADDDFGTAADVTAASSAMDFSDLYDKETMAGKHSTMYDEEEADETVKKTRVPVTICVICAIICIIATLLVLFVIPSKYNWKNWSKHNRNADGEWIMPIKEIPLDITPAPQDPVDDSDWAVPSPIVPEAEEDKIVVAPQSELVVPAPKPAEKPKMTGDIRYRIKWGDTLWDISEAYYKNPWRYPRIARYNNIKNPDLIISGTDILIPEE